MYPIIKHLHILFVVLSITGFIARVVVLQLSRTRPRMQGWTQSLWFKVAPHINDTLLLAAAIALAVYANFNPLEQPWLAAKIIALVVYVGLGAQVIKQRGSPLRQGICFVAALACFAYIVAVALSKQVLFF